MKAAMAGGAKRGKKKWSKGKMKEKLQNLVLFDQATHDKLFDQVPKVRFAGAAAVDGVLLGAWVWGACPVRLPRRAAPCVWSRAHVCHFSCVRCDSTRLGHGS